MNGIDVGQMDRKQIFIGGRWTESAANEWLDVVNPATGATFARVRAATSADVDRAVTEARASFEEGSWRRRSLSDRASVLDELADRFLERAETMGELTTLELGVPVSNAPFYTAGVVTQIRSVASLLRQTTVSEERTRADGTPSRILREPVGVVAAITAFNGALPQMSWKLIPALAAGCSVVLKTAEATPLGMSLFADIIADMVEEGLIDPGVVSILVAEAPASAHLVKHPEVDHITFTGSTAVGRSIMASASDRITRVTLELGGKSAAIVLDDANAEHVMRSLPLGGCAHTGQMCIGLTRVLVPHHRRTEFVEAYRQAMAGLTVGDPRDSATAIGPLATEAQRDKVERCVEEAVAEGAYIVYGGHRPTGLEKGFFFEPTLLDGVDNTMKIAREEVFGPVIVVIGYETEDEAVRLANDSPYGLNGSVYSTDLDRAVRVAEQIKAGTVAINMSGMDTTLPFGGFKQSGIGREGGSEGLHEFFEIKTLAIAESGRSFF